MYCLSIYTMSGMTLMIQELKESTAFFKENIATFKILNIFEGDTGDPAASPFNSTTLLANHFS